jgi:hypothetical protein
MPQSFSLVAPFPPIFSPPFETFINEVLHPGWAHVWPLNTKWDEFILQIGWVHVWLHGASFMHTKWGEFMCWLGAVWEVHDTPVCGQSLAHAWDLALTSLLVFVHTNTCTLWAGIWQSVCVGGTRCWWLEVLQLRSIQCCWKSMGTMWYVIESVWRLDWCRN